MEPIDHNLFPKIQLIELHQIGLICLYSELIFQFHHCPVIYTVNLDLSLLSLFLLSFFQNSSLPSFPFSIPRSLSPSPFLPRTRARTHPHSVTHTHTHTHTHTQWHKNSRKWLFEEMIVSVIASHCIQNLLELTWRHFSCISAGASAGILSGTCIGLGWPESVIAVFSQLFYW